MPLTGDNEYQKLISGSISANGVSVEIESPNNQMLAVQISGTWSGIVTFEGTIDGTNWAAIAAVNQSTLVRLSTASANGIYLIPSTAFQKCRVRSTAWTSGTAAISASGADGTELSYAIQADSWFSQIRGQYDEASTGLGTEDGFSTLRITQYRALHTHLRDAAGAALGTDTNPIYVNGTAELLSPLPSLKVFNRTVLTAGAAAYATQLISTKTAVKEFHVGGRLACEGSIAKYAASTTQLVPGGGGNSSVEVALWSNTSTGDNIPISWTYSTTQFVAGTGSAQFNFVKSDANNVVERTYTWSTPQDLSAWRFIQASIRVSVAAGGNQTRSVQVRMTSGTAVRIWQITGTTTTAPFSTEQWHYISGELENPQAVAGTGVFDINAVNSISIRLQDGGNKTGTIWVDDVKLSGAIDIQDKIYSGAGTTTQLDFDPVIIFNPGETLMLLIRNNGASSSEFQIAASGVDVS